jgi:Ca2+-dependent lipid-binding protein
MSLFTSHSAPRGVLTVNVVEARNLKKEDIAGRDDAYIELWLDEDYKQRTGTIKDSENPVFDETFTFNIEEGSPKHKLYYEVRDKDTVGSDKIGSGHLDISEALQGQPADTWAKLPAKLGLTSHGEIHFVLQFNQA